LVERSSCLPRAHLVGQWKRVTGDEQVIKTMLGTAFDPRWEAVVEPLDGGVVPDSPEADALTLKSGEVREFADHGEKVTMQTESATRALLVLSDTFYPGWTVTVDGVQRPIFRTNYMFRGVVLEPGTHRVEFSYWPTHLSLGIGICAVALAACGGLAWVAIRRARAVS